MKNIPGHFSPPYSDSAREDALFHYTTADGLVGIFTNNSIWNTAYYCLNDDSELETGKGCLNQLFRRKMHALIKNSDPRTTVFLNRGIDIRDVTDKFEQHIIALALSIACPYITCFCMPRGEEDFHHGLLSQWRGYGIDGGYALQFSREKLLSAIKNANKTDGVSFDIQNVHYDAKNPLKDEVEKHKGAFLKAYLQHLDENTKPLGELLNRKTIPSPLPDLLGGPLEALLNYLIQTKNKHFIEERECRLSHIQPINPIDNCLQVKYFNRNGLLVPYTMTSKSNFNILDCVEWVVIGPSPRIEARMKSVAQLIKQSGRDIKLRPSHIPFTRQ